MTVILLVVVWFYLLFYLLVSYFHLHFIYFTPFLYESFLQNRLNPCFN